MMALINWLLDWVTGAVKEPEPWNVVSRNYAMGPWDYAEVA